MSTEFVNANEKYVASFKDGHLTIPPAKKLLIVTCMDARINPYESLGLNLGDAHIVRNAGGSAKDAIRNIVISQRLLGTREIAVFHHTGCGMLTFTTPQLRDIVKNQAGSDNADVVAAAVDKIDFLEISGDLGESVKSDVEFLRGHPLVLSETKITGWVHDVATGKITQVV